MGAGQGGEKPRGVTCFRLHFRRYGGDEKGVTGVGVGQVVEGRRH